MKTNYDALAPLYNKSFNEMLDLLDKNFGCSYCVYYGTRECHNHHCREGKKKWLEAEAYIYGY